MKQENRELSAQITAPEIDQLVSRQIRKYRKTLGLSQKKVANALGVSTQQFQKYENGKDRISAGKLYQISTVLNVPIQILFEDIYNNSSKQHCISKQEKNILSIYLNQPIEVKKSIIALIKSLNSS